MKRTRSKALWMIAGIVLFVFLANVRIAPVYGSAPILLSFVVLTVACCFLGPVGGSVVGGLGQAGVYVLYYHGLWDMTIKLLPRLLGSVLGAAAAGLILGAMFLMGRQWENGLVRFLLYICAVIVAAAAGFCLVGPLVDAGLLHYPFQNALRRNLDAFVSNGLAMLLGVPVAMAAYAAAARNASSPGASHQPCDEKTQKG